MDGPLAPGSAAGPERTQGVDMPLVAIGAVLGTIYALERGSALWRRMRREKDRSRADYPISANDPTGRSIV